jgi:hypothetical protein
MIKHENGELLNELNKREVYIDNEDLETIKWVLFSQERASQNIGLFYERTKHNDREKAFADQWSKENRVGLGTSPLLDELLKPLQQEDWSKLTHRDRIVAATAIQWLGSNVGMAFLTESLKRVGYYVKKEKAIVIPSDEPERKIDTCRNFNLETGCKLDKCECENELPPASPEVKQEDSTHKDEMKKMATEWYYGKYSLKDFDQYYRDTFGGGE